MPPAHGRGSPVAPHKNTDVAGERLSQFHLLLDGRRVGPYDRRTIVGMRVRGTLNDQTLLVDADGRHITVRELLGPRPVKVRGPLASQPMSALIVEHVAPQGPEYKPSRYRGTGEVRLQGDVLRVAGARRGWFGRRHQGRVKLPLTSIRAIHAEGRRVELWVEMDDPRHGGLVQGALAFDLPDAAHAEQFAASLPSGGGPLAPDHAPSVDAQVSVDPSGERAAPLPMAARESRFTWMLLASVAMVIITVLLLALHRLLR